jgi:hypothetical protein
MQHHAIRSRLSLNLAGSERPPQVVVDSGSGGLGVDPARRGVSVYECDWQRLVQLSAAEALELLAFLQEHEGVLRRMAEEDALAVVEAGRALAERAWRVPAVDSLN